MSSCQLIGSYEVYMVLSLMLGFMFHSVSWFTRGHSQLIGAYFMYSLMIIFIAGMVAMDSDAFCSNAKKVKMLIGAILMLVLIGPIGPLMYAVITLCYKDARDEVRAWIHAKTATN